MSLRHIMVFYYCAAIYLAASTAAIAQQFQPDTELQQLYQRLDSAERRIRELEHESTSNFQRPIVATPASSSRNTFQSGDASELGDRVNQLEQQWERLTSSDEKKKKEAATKPSLKWTGRIHADYWGFMDDSPGIGFFEHPDPTAANFGTDPEDRFAFRRLRLGLHGDVLETMFYKLEVDFNNTDDPEYKDIFIGWKELPFNQSVILGNQKRPLGLDHLNSSRYNVFMERPLVVEAFNEDARRVGMAAYGYTDDERYNWRYGVYTLENSTRDGRVVGDSLQWSGNVRLASSPWYDETSDGRGYFHWAVSGMFARPDGDAFAADTNSNEGRFRTRMEARSDQRWLNTDRIAGITAYEIMGIEAMLNVGPVQVVHEYQFNWSQRENDTDLFFHGAYVFVSYFLTGEFQPYDRQRGIIGRVKPYENFFLVDRCRGGRGWGMGAWQIAARYSYLDLSDENILGGVGRNLTLGLNWFWTPYSKIQFNYIYGDIENHAPVNTFTSGNYHIFGTRFMVDF